MASTQPHWQISGEYFENCNCKVVCPCLISPNQPLTSMPTEGDCKSPFAFHINSGSYGNATLGGLNLALIAYTPGPMGAGNRSVAFSLVERAIKKTGQALFAIFTCNDSGPLDASAALFS